MTPQIPTTAETAESTLSKPPFKPRIIEDPSSNLAEEKSREAAFDSVHTWNGKSLLPFSSSRKSLFLQHRVSIGAPDLGAALKDLDGFLADAIRIIFLCSFAPTDPLNSQGHGWSRLRSDPFALQDVIDEWADTHIRPGTEHTVTLLGYQIYAASLVNQHEPAPAPHASSDDLGN